MVKANKHSETERISDQDHHIHLEPALAKLWAPKRHLLDTTDLTVDEVRCILELAAKFKRRTDNRALHTVLAGKVLACIFYENSTRTLTSFQLAAYKLGMTVLNLDVLSSSVSKGEDMKDTARTLASMGVDAIVQRHPASGSAHLIARLLGDQISIINAGDGWHGHPTQALLDLFTIAEVRPNLRGGKVAIVGDILHSRVARSNIDLLMKYGLSVHVVGPPTLMPAYMSQVGVTVHRKLEAALEGADFVIALRLQLERHKQGLIPSLEEYRRLYRLDHARLRKASKIVKLLHPGPANRGLEITDALLDDPEISLVSRQVTNGVVIRMAVLYLLLNDFPNHN